MGEFELRPSSIISVTLPDDNLKQLSAKFLMNGIVTQEGLWLHASKKSHIIEASTRATAD